VNTTGWLKGLRVTADGTGIVSHAGVALVRALTDNTGLTTGLSKALASDRLLVHDRGRVLADLACAIADGAEVISDFRVIGDQEDLFGLVASVPTAWRTLDEIARGGDRALGKITTAVNAARRRAWAGIAARHGALPGIRVADKTLDGVTCIRLDASVVTCHSDKEGAEPNFKGFGLHPLLAYCDNTGEPLAGMLRPGSAGSNTAADHLAMLDAAVTALPPSFRRRLMVTCDGAGASHDLIARLDTLAARRGYQVIYSAGWELGGRERAAIGAVPAAAWQIAVARVLPLGASLTVIELDERLIEFLRENVPYARILQGDALKLIQEVSCDVLISNLPTRVTESLIALLPRLSFRTAVLAVGESTDLNQLGPEFTWREVTTITGDDFVPPQSSMSRIVRVRRRNAV